MIWENRPIHSSFASEKANNLITLIGKEEGEIGVFPIAQ